MAHSVSEAAARAVKNSQRKVVETRTPDQILGDIRKNRAAKLFITPDDQDFLLASLDAALATAATTAKDLEIANLQYQAAVKIITVRNHEVAALENKIEEFRKVYDEENRSMALKVERIVGEGTEAPVQENV